MFIFRLLGVFIFALIISRPVPTWGAEQKGRSYTLQDVLTLAEEKNPSVGVFRSNLESARGALSSAKAYPNPDFDVHLGRGKPTEGAAARYEGEYGIEFGQPLEWPGKRSSRRKAAEAEVGASQQDFEDFRLELRSQVKEAFYNSLLSRRILEVSQRNDQTAKELVGAARLRVDSGEAPALELIKAQVELARVTAANELLLGEGEDAFNQDKEVTL